MYESGVFGRKKKRITALAHYLLDTTEEAPLPPDGYISMLCSEFGIDPERALALEPGLVNRVIEFRVAVAAKAQFNQDAAKMSKSERSIWHEIVKIAQGEGVKRGNNS